MLKKNGREKMFEHQRNNFHVLLVCISRSTDTHTHTQDDQEEKEEIEMKFSFVIDV